MPKGRVGQRPLGGTGGESPKKVDATGEMLPYIRWCQVGASRP
ncbi:hypothetical protein RintRC_2410 [Richelia intracellularis]|nr:hypothetical protein RintRC_2410 [Richelia intracellularis]